MYSPNGPAFLSPNFGINAISSSVWVPLLSAQKQTAAFVLKPSHTKQYIPGGKNQTLNSTLKVSSVQDKEQCDPEEAVAKGRATLEFFFSTFMPGEDQGIVPVFSTRMTGRSQAKRALNKPADTSTNGFLLSPISSFFTAHTFRADHLVTESTAFTAQTTHLYQDWVSREIGSAPKLSFAPNFFYTQYPPYCRLMSQETKTSNFTICPKHSSNQTPQKELMQLHWSVSKD